jgi:hypothetical protein
MTWSRGGIERVAQGLQLRWLHWHRLGSHGVVSTGGNRAPTLGHPANVELEYEGGNLLWSVPRYECLQVSTHTHTHTHTRIHTHTYTNTHTHTHTHTHKHTHTHTHTQTRTHTHTHAHAVGTRSGAATLGYTRAQPAASCNGRQP